MWIDGVYSGDKLQLILHNKLIMFQPSRLLWEFHQPTWEGRGGTHINKCGNNRISLIDGLNGVKYEAQGSCTSSYQNDRWSLCFSAHSAHWELLIEKLSGVAPVRYLGHVKCEHLHHQSHWQPINLPANQMGVGVKILGCWRLFVGAESRDTCCAQLWTAPICQTVRGLIL